MARRNKNSAAGVIVGPVVALLAMVALWKNETRFDYYRAASRTPVVSLIDQAPTDKSFCYTGPMNLDLEIRGDYIEAFVGELVVYRQAEIYCWDRDEDSDGDVTWNMEWMSSVESNSRNSGIRQELESKTLLPPSYLVGDLAVDSGRLEFVDATHRINPQNQPLTAAGQRLEQGPDYLYLRKNRGDQLGDERLSYSAIRVPNLATYFGRFAEGRGVADTSHERHGFINAMIQDTGILHHLVGGDRQTALSTMKQHITRLKWIVRGVGSTVIVLGFLIFFSALLKFLFHLPVIGWLAEKGALILALAMGVPAAGLTIAAGYLAGHPFWLATFVLLLVIAGFIGYRTYRDGRSIQRGLRENLNKILGHEVSDEEIKTREYLHIAQLVGSKSGLGAPQERMLDQWGRKQRWSPEKRKAMLHQAMLKQAEKQELDGRSSQAIPPVVSTSPGQTTVGSTTYSSEPSADENLRGLIRLAVADGQLTAYEIRTIQSAALQAGYPKQQVRELMESARRTADLRRNFLQNQQTK